jgi:hypothetical protein
VVSGFGKRGFMDSFPVYPVGSEHRLKILNMAWIPFQYIRFFCIKGLQLHSLGHLLTIPLLCGSCYLESF